MGPRECSFNFGPCPDAGREPILCCAMLRIGQRPHGVADFPHDSMPINGRKSIPQCINCARRKACLYVREVFVREERGLHSVVRNDWEGRVMIQAYATTGGGERGDQKKSSPLERERR